MESHKPTIHHRRRKEGASWARPAIPDDSNRWKELGRKTAALKISRGGDEWRAATHFDSDIADAWGAKTRIAFRDLRTGSDWQLLKQLKRRVEYLEEWLGLTGEPLAQDEYIAWCEANRDVLSRHPNSFVAIDIKKGSVVASATNQQDFSVLLKRLPTEYLQSLFQTHTSLFK
jgi:hypothetical protein